MAEEIEVSQEETAEDKDDIFVENLNTALFLLLGILAVFASAALLVHSVIAATQGLQFSMSLLITLVSAALSFVLGLGSLHLFRKRRRLRKEKTSSLFYRAP